MGGGGGRLNEIISRARLDNPIGQTTPSTSQATKGKVYLAELETTKMQSTTVKEAVVPKNTITLAQNNEGEQAHGPSQTSNTSAVITPE